MAVLSYQRPKVTGQAVTMSAAGGSGDKIKPNPNGCLMVRNGDASSKNVTVAIPGNDKYGQARPDVVVAVAAGAIALIGPFPADAADSDDFMVDVSYSATTSVTVAAIEI